MLLSELENFCAHHSDDRRRVSESTQETYKYTVARLIEYFGDVSIESFTLPMLQDWQLWVDSIEDLRVTTQNNYKRRARTMLNYARERGFDVPIFPPRFWNLRKTHKTVRAITNHNKIKMLAASGVRDTAMLMLVAESGRRRGGLVNLQTKNIHIWHNPEKGYRMVGKVREKGDKPQLMFASHHAVMALQVWLELRSKLLASMEVRDHGYVFTSYTTGKPLHPNSITHIAGRIKELADISDADAAGLHSFRHRAAKEMLKEGMSLPEVRDILGHSSSVVTADMYIINDEEDLTAVFFDKRKF